MASDLPRPVTPGPWEAVDEYDADCGSNCTTYGCFGHSSGMTRIDPLEGPDGSCTTTADERDDLAIAALPDWIARADALEARVAELERVVEAVRECCIYRMPYGQVGAAAAGVILALLPPKGGEATDGA